ncbi:MAG TPA: dihydrolipoamide acetyltransferase family protein [Solirubrobacterales bacterium]|nr:dihydrolipoamide acetyltransferase family protein [Solirubrobacterales bacterium]
MDDIVMPRLSDSMEEGTVLRWLKSPGDQVAVGDELVEIETDKANMVYESDLDGTIVEILAQEGDTLPVGDPIARVGDASEVASDNGGGAGVAAPAGRGGDGSSAGARVADQPPVERPKPAGASTPAPPPAPAASPPSPAGVGGDGRTKASPIARRIARDRGLDLSGLSGSGPGGRIVKADVERALESATAPAPATQAAPPPPAAPPTPAAPTPGASEKPETAKGAVEVVELTKLQQTVARRMAESKATAPHFYLQAEIDMTAAVEGRAQLKASAGEGEVVPTFNDMVVKACALALREHPRANGAYRDGKIELYSRVNVGVAVAAQDALVVPTVFDADQKGLRRIATETRALAARVRDGSITPPELSGGTFTVSNLGMYGISNFGAVINTPQAGILAVGEVKAKPVIREGARQRDPFDEVGEIQARQLMGVTLACDHRILYGADGAEFLARVRGLLEQPLGLAL